MSKLLLVAAFLTCSSFAHADVIVTNLILAHDVDVVANLDMTVTKDIGDALIANRALNFRLESADGKSLVPGDRLYSAGISFYNSMDGHANVYFVQMSLFPETGLDEKSDRVNFFVNLKHSKLVFYGQVDGQLKRVYTVDMSAVCAGKVTNLSRSSLRCDISPKDVF